MSTTPPSGNEVPGELWLRRSVHVDRRTPAEVGAEHGWDQPLPPPPSAESLADRARVNPYVATVDDLRAHIVPIDEAEAHRGRWQDRFDAPRPLIVELGSGAGDFLAGEARLRPDANYLGLELRYKRLAQAVGRTRHLPNVQFARYHAAHLGRVFAPGEISGVYVQFPDPWPRAKQANRRMVNPATVALLAELLPPGGWVRMKSDWPLYLPWMRGSFEGAPFDETAFVADLRQWDLPWANVQTTFERRFMRVGKPCFFLEYTRR